MMMADDDDYRARLERVQREARELKTYLRDHAMDARVCQKRWPWLHEEFPRIFEAVCARGEAFDLTVLHEILEHFRGSLDARGNRDPGQMRAREIAFGKKMAERYVYPITGRPSDADMRVGMDKITSMGEAAGLGLLGGGGGGGTAHPTNPSSQPASRPSDDPAGQ